MKLKWHESQISTFRHKAFSSFQPIPQWIKLIKEQRKVSDAWDVQFSKHDYIWYKELKNESQTSAIEDNFIVNHFHCDIV